MCNKNGLTLSMVFEAESANYGEGFANTATLKKLSRGDGNAYTYISRQALRFNMINQLGWDKAESLGKDAKDKSVIQFAPGATIDKFEEIDLFGYMKTSGKTDSDAGGSLVRNAVVRLSNAIALESYNSETDFLTNMGLAKRLGVMNNIAQSEIHKSLYAYTLTIDLDRIGEDGNIHLPKEEKAKRVKEFLTVLITLYRDIRGRRENLSPLFAIGGTYERKNPFFENRIAVNKGILDVQRLEDSMNIFDGVKENTEIGYVSGTFKNDAEVKEKLKTKSVGEFFTDLCRKVDEFYA